MKTVNPRRKQLVQLNARLQKIEFGSFARSIYHRNDPNYDGPSTGEVVKGAAKVAAVGGAAYAGASYLRGRLSQNPSNWNFAQNRPGLAGVKANIAAGHRANVGDAKSALGALKAKLGTATNAVGDRAAAIGQAASNAASAVKNAAAVKSRLFR